MPSKTVAWHLAVAINQTTGRVVRKAVNTNMARIKS